MNFNFGVLCFPYYYAWKCIISHGNWNRIMRVLPFGRITKLKMSNKAKSQIINGNLVTQIFQLS